MRSTAARCNTLEGVDVECTHCGIRMASHTGGGGTIRYFHCASCQRWTSSVYTEVFKADTKMRTRAQVNDEPVSAFGQVKERLGRWLKSLEDQNPYQVLGASPLDSDDVIRERYRRLARMHHPDSGGDLVLMRRVNEAYEQVRKQRSEVHAAQLALATGV